MDGGLSKGGGRCDGTKQRAENKTRTTQEHQEDTVLFERALGSFEDTRWCHFWTFFIANFHNSSSCIYPRLTLSELLLESLPKGGRKTRRLRKLHVDRKRNPKDGWDICATRAKTRKGRLTRDLAYLIRALLCLLQPLEFTATCTDTLCKHLHVKAELFFMCFLKIIVYYWKSTFSMWPNDGQKKSFML